MTTASLVPDITTSVAGRPARRRLPGAEWIKLRSLRSTWILLASVVVLFVVVPAFTAVGAVVQARSGTAAGEADAIAMVLTGVSPVEFLVAALGALAVTGEYSSGLIRVTLAAVPRRVPVLVAKAAVIGAVTFATAMIAVPAAFLTVRLVLSSAGLVATGDAQAVVVSAMSAGAYLTGVALIGIGFGWVLRSTAGALAAFFGFMYIPPLLAMLPGAAGIAPFLPSNAGAVLLRAAVAEPMMAAIGALVFAAWVAALLAVAALILRRRDA